MLVATALVIASGAAGAAPPDGVTAFVRHHLTRYRMARADLNGDGRPEALVYAIDAGSGTADQCGSGGCDLYVLSLVGHGYRVVTELSVTRPPIRLLATRAHGWHDLAVLVAGGGIPGYTARLRFDGQSYPTNATVPPATHLSRAQGQVLIGPEPTR